MSWRIFTHHTLKTLLQAAQVLIFVGLPIALGYLHFVGLPRAFYPALTEAAGRAGLDLTFSRMRLSPLQGLVLDDVRLNAENLPDDHEIGVDRAAVGLDWSKLLRGKVDLTSLDLRGAQLSLPLPVGDGSMRTLRLTKARARLVLSDGVLSVPVARFNVQGIDITATGRMLLEPAEGAPPAALGAPDLGKFVDLLESFGFGKNPPQLEIEFSARAGDLAALQLPRIRFEAPEVTRAGAQLRSVRLDATFDHRTLYIQSASARDQRGSLLALTGSWNAATGSAEASLDSSLDFGPWLAQFQPNGPWKDLLFTAPPRIQATLSLPPGETRRAKVLGTIETGGGEFRHIPFRGISAGFAWQNGDFYARDLLVELPAGQIEADLMIRPDNVRLRVEGHADPLLFVSLLDEKERESLAKLEAVFIDVPEIFFEASGPRLDPAVLKATGKLKLGRASIHDSTLDSATADLAFQDRALTLSNIRAVRPEGTATGAFTYDFARSQVRLDGIRSTMNPFNVLQWADPKVARETIPYRFKAPPEVTTGGIIELKDPTLTRLWANFTAPQGLDYDLLERTLNFGPTTGSLEFTGRKIGVRISSAELFGGKVKLDATINTGQPGARQEMTLDLDAVNFEKLTKLYFDYDNSQGVVSGRYEFSFVGGQPREMRGKGSLLVQEGNVFAIPVLGPLSAVLDTIVPGTGYQTAREATCDYKVERGVISTENLEVVGRGFSMIGQGKLFYLEDRMDFGVRINAQGVPGLLLYPVSKLFEYVSDGKLSEPQWRPRILPKGGKNPPKNGAPAPSAGAGPNGPA
ncbi:MAG: hypothetical protein ACOYOL_02595 [Chthoniobacterales bacterium]